MNENEFSGYEKRRGQYLLLIDKAILKRRYTLAVQLANRCLIQYYKIFLKSVNPRTSFREKTTYQIALRLIKYLRKYPRRYSWFSSQERQFDILSASFYITSYMNRRKEMDITHLDRTHALYARNHSLAIVQHLLKYLGEKG